ncbi:hypothetical protein SCUCBS95973_007975 [Sporothrix curviconia]|uniref:N-acetyltransferase domain-containing protein n=1 Tax=Sporothrix curviconia TaxID=1260050 RepID=A0ABP0CI93_9PEZI
MPPMSQDTSYSVVSATIDDMGTASRLQFEAISPTSPVDQAIYPLGMTDTALAAATATKKRKFYDSNVQYKMVVASYGTDSKESQIVAFARWYIWSEDRAASVWDKPYSFSPEEGLAPADMNFTAAKTVYGTIGAFKGSAIYGRGCGRLLMAEAIHTAKLHGLDDIYLVSTAAAFGWYKEFNFETVDTIPFDLVALTGKEVDEDFRWSNMYLLRTSPV